MKITGLLLLFALSPLLPAADTMTVDSTNVVVVNGTAPGTTAAGEVRIGGGQIKTGGQVVVQSSSTNALQVSGGATVQGTVSGGNVTIGRASQATGAEAVRGDDARLGGGTAKAWVTFNGADGTVRASFNVASVVRNYAGNYTITFTKPFASIDYVGIGTAEDDNSRIPICYEMGTRGQYRTTSTMRVQTYGLSAGLTDFQANSWVFFGN